MISRFLWNPSFSRFVCLVCILRATRYFPVGNAIKSSASSWPKCRIMSHMRTLAVHSNTHTHMCASARVCVICLCIVHCVRAGTFNVVCVCVVKRKLAAVAHTTPQRTAAAAAWRSFTFVCLRRVTSVPGAHTGGIRNSWRAHLAHSHPASKVPPRIVVEQYSFRCGCGECELHHVSVCVVLSAIHWQLRRNATCVLMQQCNNYT